MKKKSLISTLLLLFLLTLASCNNVPSIPEDTCDPEWEECGDNEETKDEVNLKEYSGNAYSFNLSSDNDKGSVTYEIFVRSFYDSNNDGIGDLNGITSKLDYLKDLGVKTLWLMPINSSPSYHGYDVSDYYNINSDYGTLSDFQNLINEAKKYNIEIMMDMVFNHSSKYNKWFIDSANDYLNNNTSINSKKDWYSWSDTPKSGYSEYSSKGIYYESNFDSSMPEFNIYNEEVKKEMINILNYYIDMGVKGFRFDACLYFDYNNTSANASYLTYLKENIKEPSTYFVGETWAGIDIVNEYYKSKCDSFFKFNASLTSTGDDAILSQVKGLRSAKSFCDAIEKEEETLKINNPNGYSSYFLSNHDMNRSAHSFSGISAKDAASLYLMLPGTPYIYYGEEIGLKGKRGNESTDVLRRLPLIWNEKDKTGECAFPEKGYEYLYNGVSQVSKGINDLKDEGYSLLNHYKKVINIRNQYSFIKEAKFISRVDDIVSNSENIICYELQNNEESIIVLTNFSDYNYKVDISKLNVKTLDNEVSASKLVSELNGNTLSLAKHSMVVLR